MFDVESPPSYVDPPCADVRGGHFEGGRTGRIQPSVLRPSALKFPEDIVSRDIGTGGGGHIGRGDSRGDKYEPRKLFNLENLGLQT